MFSLEVEFQPFPLSFQRIDAFRQKSEALLKAAGNELLAQAADFLADKKLFDELFEWNQLGTKEMPKIDRALNKVIPRQPKLAVQFV